MSSEAEPSWRVGELARATGLTVRTLRFYDERGLVVPGERTHAGHRRYGRQEVERLYRVLALRRLGLELKEIEAVLAGGGPSPAALLDAQLREVEQRQAALQRLRERLRAVRSALDSDPQPSVDGLIEVMEAYAMYERHYSAEQLEALESRRDALGAEGMERAQAEWQALMDALREEMEAGTDPADPRLEPHRRKADELLAAFTGGDPGIRASLDSLWAEEDPVQVSHGMVDRALWDYWSRVCGASGGGRPSE